MKKIMSAIVAFSLGFAAFAQEQATFDPASFLTTANTSVTSIVTAVGVLLATALGLYLAFVGYRKAREALNKA